jgi:CRP/FNR family transcriptional regulator, cyclic AMP receptor protein
MPKQKQGSAPPIPIDWTRVPAGSMEYAGGATIFAQGQACATVLFIEKGTVRLTVVSNGGKEAIIALVEAGHFFGEGCLAGQPVRVATAVAMSDSTIRALQKHTAVRLLQSEPWFAEAFLRHMLKRNVRIEADLIDQLFNSTEKRLARTLLLLARYGDPDGTRKVIPKMSQELLAEMVGTTRTRVNFFMNKFRKLGFIRYNDTITVNNSLLGVLLRD